MAAPSGIKWGSIAGSKGRIGIYVKLTNTATQTTRHTEIWFWSKWSVSDSSNTFYYNDNATSATTSKGSVSIKTSVSTGDGWSTSNQVKIKEYDYTFNRGTSASTRSVAAKLTGIDVIDGTMTCVASYTIPALASYTISYNANGGSGAPSAQTKYYGKALTLSSTKPTRTGYAFQGWATSASGGVAYASGASYTANASVTLYAVWKANTYYLDINGYLDGSGQNNISGYGTCDVYINGSLVSNDISDYYTAHNYGSTYEIKDIKATTGHTYNGVHSGSLSGTITSTTGVSLNFTTNTYTVSYNANGGSGAPSSQTKTYGQTLVLSSTKPTRSGYNFLGWSTSSTATSATYNAGGNYVNNSSATLYAVWTQSTFIQTIMARYQLPNGGYTSYSQVYAASLNQGNTCSWSSPETDEYKAASVSYTVGTSAETKYVTVYRKQYTISYDANGGLFAPRTQSFYYGCNLRLSNKRPTRSGYDFLGWASTSDATIPNYKIEDIFDSTNTSNPTLYAVWSKSHANIYLYETGLCEAGEYVESDSLYFDADGAIYTSLFTEEILSDGQFSIGLEFIASEISEIHFEKYYLIDESSDLLVDENGNYLFLEEEV